MRGKWLTSVGLMWIGLAAINHVVRFTYWDALFMDQENPAMIGLGHVIGEFTNSMDFALLMTAIGLALWVSQNDEEVEHAQDTD